MTRLCENCGFVNQDDYDFCAKCGNPLVEGLKPKNFIVFKPEQYKINKKDILLSYCRNYLKKHQNCSIHIFRIFHAVLSSAVKTSDNQKTWSDNDDYFTGGCCTLFLCDV